MADEEENNAERPNVHRNMLPGNYGNKRPKLTNIGSFRQRNLHFSRDAYRRPVGLGRSTEVDVYVPESTKRHTEIVCSMCWHMMSICDDQDVLTALFNSALGAFSDELLSHLILASKERCVKVRIVSIPTDAKENGLNIANYIDRCSYEETLVNVGILFMLPFKNMNKNNFERFIDIWKKRLASIVGLGEKERDKMKFPLDLEKAILIQCSLAGNMDVRQAICKYLMQTAEDSGKLKEVALYVNESISWNAMSIIVFINNVFVGSGSPVIKCKSIADEVGNFHKAMCHILRSPCPRHFRHYCTAAEASLLQRHNYRVLGAVARELLRKKEGMKNFVGTADPSSNLVNSLVKLHIAYCEQNAREKDSKDLAWFIDGHYSELLDYDENVWI